MSHKIIPQPKLSDGLVLAGLSIGIMAMMNNEHKILSAFKPGGVASGVLPRRGLSLSPRRGSFPVRVPCSDEWEYKYIGNNFPFEAISVRKSSREQSVVKTTEQSDNQDTDAVPVAVLKTCSTAIKKGKT